jgi:hypothetical protein
MQRCPAAASPDYAMGTQKSSTDPYDIAIFIKYSGPLNQD